MKNIYVLVVITFIMFSCNREFDNAMKTADKATILSVANKYYGQKKWKQSLALYERLNNLVIGTSDEADVRYKTAYANYYDKNYRLAGHQFKSFSLTNPNDSRVEEALYMSALCYYQGSQDYNLDQENTITAIDELQEFLNKYPDSERSKNIASLVDELSYKLELKAYENARQYYKMGEYKAADIAFENVLEDYPATKLRSQIYNHMLKSKEILALNSVFDLKEERINGALAFTRQVQREFPNTENDKLAQRIRENLEKERVKFADQIKEYENKKLEQKAKLEKLNSEQKRGRSKEERAEEIKIKDLQRGAAQVKTPSSSANINLKRKK